MGCNYKPKHTCGDIKSNSRCVFYDIDVPEFSKLYYEECLTVEETTDDLYSLISDIRDNIDTSGINTDCLEIDRGLSLGGEGVKVGDLLKALVLKACESSDSGGIDSNVIKGLDFKCLVSSCDTSIGSIKELLQVLINEVCILKENNEG